MGGILKSKVRPPHCGQNNSRLQRKEKKTEKKTFDRQSKTKRRGKRSLKGTEEESVSEG